MLAIINEILTFKDSRIRASTQPTIAEGMAGALRRSSLEARGGERDTPSRPSPLLAARALDESYLFKR